MFISDAHDKIHRVVHTGGTPPTHPRKGSRRAAPTLPHASTGNDDETGNDDASVFASGALARIFILDGVVFTKDGNDADVSSGDADDGF